MMTMNRRPERQTNNAVLYGLQQGQGARRPQPKHRGKEVAVLGPVTCGNDSGGTLKPCPYKLNFVNGLCVGGGFQINYLKEST